MVGVVAVPSKDRQETFSIWPCVKEFCRSATGLVEGEDCVGHWSGGACNMWTTTTNCDEELAVEEWVAVGYYLCLGHYQPNAEFDWRGVLGVLGGVGGTWV